MPTMPLCLNPRNALPRRRRRAGVSQLDPRQRNARPPRHRRIRRALEAAEPRAKFDIDQGIRDGNTTDSQRAWLHMELVLENAGVALDDRTAAALEELRLPCRAQPLGIRARRCRARAATAVGSRTEAGGGLERQRRAAPRVRPPRPDAVLPLHLRFLYRGWGKPDPRFFQIALDRSGSPPTRRCNVGDLYYVDVVGARASGLRAMLIDPLRLRIRSTTLIGCGRWTPWFQGWDRRLEKYQREQERGRRGEREDREHACSRGCDLPARQAADPPTRGGVLPLLPLSCCIETRRCRRTAKTSQPRKP